MTMVRPCRLITRQRSHMGFTEGLTFIRKFPQTEVAHGQTPRDAGRHGTRNPLSGEGSLAGCDCRVREKDAGHVGSGATEMTEDTLPCRQARPDGTTLTGQGVPLPLFQ